MKKIQFILIVAITFLFTICGFSQIQKVSKQNLDDPKELENYLEPIVKRLMERLYAPGTVIAVVKDGKLFFTKGYGYANVEKKTPVIPDKTIFRIGSITKVFTANATVQLADRGKIKLNEDVNKYLKDLKIDEKFPQPITVANLLSHTAGLDEFSSGRRTRFTAFFLSRSYAVLLFIFCGMTIASHNRLIKLMPELSQYYTFSLAKKCMLYCWGMILLVYLALKITL